MAGAQTVTAQAPAGQAPGGGHRETLSIHDFRPRGRGTLARVLVALAVPLLLLVIPLFADSVWDSRIALAAIYAIIGLSVNVITGHAGQISLGHQAFVGIGAFISSYVAVRLAAGFGVAIVAAAITGGLMAMILGLVALRIRGLYLALITLAFGLMAETTVFNWRAFTGGGAGAAAPKPTLFVSDQAYAYLCLLVLGVVLFLDWRLVKSKAGRAIVALRNDERVAATLGVNVTAYKLYAFVLGGALAGVAGSLFAHWNTIVTAPDFELRVALVWVLMAVVGGFGSRAGVVIGSAFFAIFPFLFPGSTINLSWLGLGDVLVQTLSPLLGALLLLVTLTLYPGGIGQQLLPLRRWLAGGVLVDTKKEALRFAGLPTFTLLIVTTVLVMTTAQMAFKSALVYGLAVGVIAMPIAVFLLLRYTHAVHRTLAAPAGGPPAAEATAPVPDQEAPPVPPALAEEQEGGS